MAENITGPGGTPAPPAEATYGSGRTRMGPPSFESYVPGVVRRVSWGAIFAGTVVALVVMLALDTLGLGILFTTIDPATEARPLSGVGVGTGIWLVVSTLISLFAGGWTAGRLAGVPRRTDGVLHGIVTWGLVSLLSTWFVFNVLGQVVSGAVGAVGSTLGFVGQGVGAMAPAAAEGLRGLGGPDVGAELERFLRQTGDPQLSPEALRNRAEEAVGEAPATAAQQPQNAFDVIQGALSRLAIEGQGVINEVDRQDAINVIVARTELTEAQAARVVDNWVQTWNDLRGQIGTTAQQVGETAAQVTEDVTDAVGSALLWSFVLMVFGVLAAGFGGSAGAPREVVPAITTGGVGVTREH